MFTTDAPAALRLECDRLRVEQALGKLNGSRGRSAAGKERAPGSGWRS